MGRDVPKGTDETPGLTDKGDKDTDGSGLGMIAIHGISDHDGGDDLVSGASDGDPDDGRDVPFHQLRVCGLDEEDDDADDGEDEARV